MNENLSPEHNYTLSVGYKTSPKLAPAVAVLLPVVRSIRQKWGVQAIIWPVGDAAGERHE